MISFAWPAAPVSGGVYPAAGSQGVFNIGNLNHWTRLQRTVGAHPGDRLGAAPEPRTRFWRAVALTALGLMRRRQGG